MIIGIAGLAGSGKDTVADYLVKNHSFAKISLADPLKRICREVFDFSEEQLWGPSDKRNEPDKRYRRLPHYHLIIDVRRIDDPQYKEDRTCGRCWQKGPAPHGPEGECFSYLTPRHALQQLGTEWGRACYENVWIDYALRVAKKLIWEERYDYLYSQMDGLHDRAEADSRLGRPYYGVVIPDVRFKNEVNAINAAGGKVWRIHRKVAGLSGAAGQHQSEVELDSIPKESFSIHLYNDSSLETLYDLVEKSLPRTA